MRTLLAAIFLCSPLFAADPSIVGPPTDDTAAGVVRVQVGNPPWVPLTVKDAPAKSVATWKGPIGIGQVAAYARDGGLSVSTAIPGTYEFRCILQIPSDGLDPTTEIDVTVIVEGTGPQPPPVPPGPGPQPPPKPVPPVPNVSDKITEAVKANPDASLSGVADMYDKMAEQAAGGSLTIPQIQAGHQLASALSAPWAAISKDIVDPYLKTLTLAKPGDYAPVWHQIAAGIKAGLAPQPQPVPVDPPKPVDPINPPAPIPAAELRVLILYDDTKNLTAAQTGIINSAPLRTWLNQQGAKWRVWPITVDATMEDQSWRDAIAKRSGAGPCWLMVSNGKTGFNGDMPTAVAEVEAKVMQFKP